MKSDKHYEVLKPALLLGFIVLLLSILAQRIEFVRNLDGTRPETSEHSGKQRAKNVYSLALATTKSTSFLQIGVASIKLFT